MANQPLLIVGASIAGLRTAESARRAGFEGPITFLGAETHRPYNRPPLSKGLLCTHGQGHQDVAFPLRSGLEEGVDWVLDVELEWDVLVVAVGDAARYVNALFDSIPRRVEHWRLPTETGKRAGQILAV